MKTMGLERLIIVTATPVDYEASSITAVDAVDVLQRARVVPEFGEILGDYHFLAAMTARTRRFRNCISLPDLPGLLNLQQEGCRVGIVFGRENSGLTNDEIALCQCSVVIPTSKQLRSLNLSHAVQLVCYELLRSGLIRDITGPDRPKKVKMATAMEREAIFAKLNAATQTIALGGEDAKKLEKCFRILLEERPMQKREAGALHRFMDQIVYGPRRSTAGPKQNPA